MSVGDNRVGDCSQEQVLPGDGSVALPGASPFKRTFTPGRESSRGVPHFFFFLSIILWRVGQGQVSVQPELSGCLGSVFPGLTQQVSRCSLEGNS